MTSERGLGVDQSGTLAGIHDGLDGLTARSTLRSLGLAGVLVALPALVRTDAARYYLLQSVLLLTGAAVLFLRRRFLAPRTLARAVIAVGALTAVVAALLSGGAYSPAYHAYSVTLVGAAWLVLSPPVALRTTGAILGVGVVIAVLTAWRWLPEPWLTHSPFSVWMTTSTASGLIALVQWLEVHRLTVSNAAASAELERREAAQRQVALGEQRYADVVSTAPGVVFEFEMRRDGSGAFTFMSEGARTLFDRPPADLLADARRLFEMFPPADRPRAESTLAGSRDALTPWELEGEIRTPAGRTKWLRAHALPARLPDGTVRWHGFLTDMSERIKTERALRTSEDALKQSLSLIQAAFESTADGLLIVDRDGRVKGHNQKFLALWRVPEVLARTHDDDQLLAHIVRQVPEPDTFRARVSDIYSQRDAVSFDTLVLSDGRQYERYSQPQIVDGAVAGRVWSFRDVTARAGDDRHRAELEQQLQQAQTLEALGALAGGLAHDFNNLLTIILANAEQAAVETSPAGRDASLAAITAAAARAGALVREIRMFSEPRATDRTIVAVAGTIDHAVQLLRSSMPKNITIDVRLDPNVTMLANPTQVQQVVTNLALHAAQAIGDAPGRIDIALDDVAAAEVPDATPRPLAARYARLVVTDTGRGLAADATPRLFEPFFAARSDGGGLGLAVVSGIVRRYHGTVTIESVSGDGTTFRVFWPAVPPEAIAPPPVAAGATDLGAHHRHVLVVDDEPAIARVIAESLRRIGYEVTSATDPLEALRIFTTQPAAFDAVLTDLSMPQLSGAALGRRMLDLRPDTPIVLFTGYRAELSPDEALAAGFRAVLNKPMSLAMLAEALHRVLPAPSTA